MPKEEVTIKFLGSRVYYFTATKPGRRGSKDAEKLLEQFAEAGLGPAFTHQLTDGKSGFFLIMSLTPRTDQLKMLHRVKRSFAKAGYKVATPTPRRR